MKTDIQGTLETIRAEAAKREARMILTVVGLLIAGITILSFVLN